MQKRLNLVYFEGCPNAEKARQILQKLGAPFEAIDQDSLPAGHQLLQFSSPSILLGDRLIYGTKTSGDSRGCSFEPWDAEKLSEAIKQALR